MLLSGLSFLNQFTDILAEHNFPYPPHIIQRNLDRMHLNEPIPSYIPENHTWWSLAHQTPICSDNNSSESEDTVGDVNIVNNSNIVNWLLWFWVGITMKTGGLECGLVGITHKHTQF